MKVVAISCSPRVGGNCDKIIDRIITGILDGHKDAVVDKYKLSTMNINGCKACYSCKKGEGCIQKDDMQLLYGKLNDADLIIFASPIYMGHITGTGKNFMDRMFAYMKEHFEVTLPKGKKAIIVLTQGHQVESAYRRVADDLINFFNSYGIETVSQIIAAGLTLEVEDINKNVLEHAYRVGQKMVI
ncbi:flavodoxin family protein [Thermobrachium celere]|uniref:Iron-sulfur flavoprotein n=1 Tax=Thermobrachium celere DSM 8682 TaxID=941824 RepID=R7RSZ8_9CLOT|nr:flavodoxin family protein [Thermobrachium celere]GFR34625.1 FMN reductase [Thermobrachium celere]CDF59327.1 iron-sulfur flavoprotein [Thermobrachium celere DSM 8682]